MINSEMNTIRQKIEKQKTGTVFIISDFTNDIKYQNAKKCLLRLEKEGLIRRVVRGVYDKPYFSKVLNEQAAPNIEEVAKAIARSYNWKIAPCGLTALNLLGLSTQVTNSYEYYSSGQYKTYQIGKISIIFKHKSSKELLDLSYISSLMVQAIKESGTNLDNSIILKLQNKLTPQEKQTILKEARGVTKWIYEIIKKICSKENQ